MNDLISLISTLGVVFFGSMIIAYGITRKFNPKSPRNSFIPIVNSISRIKTSTHLYRSRFIKAEKKGWVFSTPVKQHPYMPLNIGEKIIVESDTIKGKVIFRSMIVEYDQNNYTYTIKKPLRTFLKSDISSNK